MATKVSGQRGYFKQEVLKMTGWTKEEYTKKYDIFKHKVRNYNLVTGQKLSPAEQFYYKLRADRKARRDNMITGTNYNYIQTAINQMPSITKSAVRTRQNEAIRSIARSQIEQRFSGLTNPDKMPNVKWRERFLKIEDAYRRGNLTLEEYNKSMSALATRYNKLMQNANENNLIGSQ